MFDILMYHIVHWIAKMDLDSILIDLYNFLFCISRIGGIIVCPSVRSYEIAWRLFACLWRLLSLPLCSVWPRAYLLHADIWCCSHLSAPQLDTEAIGKVCGRGQCWANTDFFHLHLLTCHCSQLLCRVEETWMIYVFRDKNKHVGCIGANVPLYPLQTSRGALLMVFFFFCETSTEQ